MMQRKVYDREFKENAVKLSYERDNLSQFARKLAISIMMLKHLLNSRNNMLGYNKNMRF